MDRLAKKVAVITGAGSGIGRGTALLFAKEGCKVVVADLNLAAAQETCDLIKKEGGSYVAVKVDVSKAADVQNMFAAGAYSWDANTRYPSSSGRGGAGL